MRPHASVYIFTSALFTLFPLFSLAQPSPRAPLSVCHTATLTPRPHGYALLGSTLPGDGAAHVDRVTLAPFSFAIARTQTADATPAGVAIVRCSNDQPPTLVATADSHWRGEDLGARVRADVAIVRTPNGSQTIVRGQRHEALSPCGVGPLLTQPAALDPHTLRWSPVSLSLYDFVSSLPATATTVTVSHNRSALLAPALSGVLSGERFSDTLTTRTSDGLTLWFAVEQSLHQTRAIDLTVDAESPPARFVVALEPGPRALAVELTSSQRTALSHGETLSVALPVDALSTAPTCASVIFPQGAPIGLRSVRLRTDLDTLEDPVSVLVSEASRPDGIASARLLANGPEPWLSALTSSFHALPRASAIAALTALSHRHGSAVDRALSAALSRDDLSTDALAIVRTRGQEILPVLSTIAVTEPMASTALCALRLPLSERLRALALALASDGPTGASARLCARSLAREASHTPTETVLLSLTNTVAQERWLNALGENITVGTTLSEELAGTALPLFETHTSFVSRWRLIPALAGSIAGRTALSNVVTHDPDPDLRVAAVRALERAHALTPTLARSVTDAVPRVRVAAVTALHGRPEALQTLTQALRSDSWPSVRAASARAISPLSEGAPALVRALDDASVPVVEAVLEALALSPARVTASLTAFALDARRASSLRRSAIEALSNRCDPSAAPALERIAEASFDSALPPWEREVGHSAIAALARVSPARARAWIATMQPNAAALSALERSARGGCGAH